MQLSKHPLTAALNPRRTNDRYKEVILTADLIDRARPGEDIEVTGVYKYRADPGGFNARNGFPVFSTCIEVQIETQTRRDDTASWSDTPTSHPTTQQTQANYVHKREDMFSMLHITDEDKAAIHRIAAAPNTSELLMQCVCVSLFVYMCLNHADQHSHFMGMTGPLPPPSTATST